MQKNYSLYYTIAAPGQIEGYGSPGIRTFKNSAADVLWSNTIAVPSSVDSNATYSVTLTGATTGAGSTYGLGGAPYPFGTTFTATYTTGSSDTQASVAAGLLLAIRQQGSPNGMFNYVVPTLSGSTITLTSRYAGQNYTIASPSNATTTNDLTIGTAVASAYSSPIPFGRFVVSSTSGPVDQPSFARLPATASNVVVRGVTVAPRAAAVKNVVGPTGQAFYYPDEAMDVYVRTADTTGIWVLCDNTVLNTTLSSALYIDCNTSGKLGQLTATATSNLAVPSGVTLVQGFTPTAVAGENVCLVTVNV
jgi:hypothetical protein